MNIITPASEYNSTERVNHITFKVIEFEIRRARELLFVTKGFPEICKKVDFFNSYPLCIEIDICGNNKSKDD